MDRRRGPSRGREAGAAWLGVAAAVMTYGGALGEARAAWGVAIEGSRALGLGGLGGCFVDLRLWQGLSMVEAGPAPCGGSLAFDFGALALIFATVVIVVRMRLVAESRRLELARRYLEQGREPPLELFPSAAQSDLRRGVILIAAGVGLLVTGAISEGPGVVGLVPGFVGLGYLVSYGLARRAGGEKRR